MMNVSELIEMLQNLPPDAEIRFCDFINERSVAIERIEEECGYYVLS